MGIDLFSPIVFVLILAAEMLGSNLTLILTLDSQLKEDFFSSVL